MESVRPPTAEPFTYQCFNSTPQHNGEIMFSAINEFKLARHETPVCSAQGLSRELSLQICHVDGFKDAKQNSLV